MNNKEKVSSSGIDQFGNNGHNGNGHDNNGHDRDDGHDHKQYQEITENIVNPLEIANKYKEFPLEVFAKILDDIDLEKQDKDLETVSDLIFSLSESIQICQQLAECFGYNFASSMYQHHYSRAELLDKTLEQFLWFAELKEKNCAFNFSTIEHNGHDN